jgi:FMN-dependent NADH-azoreductase
MSKLIYVEASPLKARSHSIAVANAFLERYRAVNPHDEIERIDLWNAALPPFDAETIEAKFAVLRAQQFSATQFARWESVRAVSRQFNSAGKYVFSVPMWNFGIPYPLKHYVDIVTLPGENWTWSRAAGYATILSGKKALLVFSSANDYTSPDPSEADFQKPYMRRWLRFIGVESVREIVVAPTLADPAEVAAARAAAMAQAVELAATF